MKTKAQHNHQAEEDVANTIYEFLEWANLDETLASFVAECKKRKVPIHLKRDSPSSGNPELKDDLLAAFEEGNGNAFFRQWPKAVGETKDKQTQVLEFYLQVYFTTAPLRDSNASKISLSKSMEKLKNYLERGDGTKLSKIPELAPYFALPYVVSPKQHPLFKDLTQEKWMQIIQQKLEKFLRLKLSSVEVGRNGRQNSDQKPKLLRLIRESSEEKSTSESKDKMAKLQRKVNDAENLSSKYKDMYGQLQKDYHNQIVISSELVDALEQTIKGAPISAEYLENLSARLMESNKAAQAHDVAQLKGAANSNHLEAKDPTSAASTQPPSMRSTLEDDMGSFRSEVLSLNYPKIRNQISQFPIQRETILLLQAVRWRLTQAPKEVREPQLQSFCNGDILGIKSGAKSGKTVPNSVYSCESKNSKESLSRLINALASTKTGRAYLVSVVNGRDVMQSIVTALKMRRIEEFAQEHALAALQKLSLRKKIQLELIGMGTVDWLMQFLTTYSRLSDYALEYGSALLMNLSLNSVGKQACARNPESLVKLLINLLQHKNQEIHPYLNGILYSTLSVQKIRKKAQEMGMDSVIEAVLETSKNSHDLKQLPFLLKQLRGELPSQNNADSDDENMTEDDEDEEDDYLESELDSNDTICGKPGDLIGEALLRARYVPSQTPIPKREEPRNHVLDPSKSKPKPTPNRLNPVGQAKRQPPVESESEPPGTVPPRISQGLTVPRRTGTASTFTVADGVRRPEPRNRPATKESPRRSLSPRKAPSTVNQEKQQLSQETAKSQASPTLLGNQSSTREKTSLSVARQNRHGSPKRALPHQQSEDSDAGKLGFGNSSKVSPTRAKENKEKEVTKNKEKRRESPPVTKTVPQSQRNMGLKETTVTNRHSRLESPRNKGKNKPTPEKPGRTESPRKVTKTESPARPDPRAKYSQNEPNESPTRKGSTKEEQKEAEKQRAKEKIAASRRQRLSSQTEAKKDKSPDKSPDASVRSEIDTSTASKKPSGIPRSKENQSSISESRKRSQSQSQALSRDRQSTNDKDTGEVQTKQQRGRSNSNDQILSPGRNSLTKDREEERMHEDVSLRAPSIGKMNTRIPDEANALEYAQIFGARPKVIRTPDNEALKKRNNAISLFF